MTTLTNRHFVAATQTHRIGFAFFRFYLIMDVEDSFYQVAIRLKPSSVLDVTDEQCGEEPIVQQSQENKNVLIVGENRMFLFDKVFNQESRQEEIYENLVKSQISKLVEGYNCSCLGKFFKTIVGKNSDLNDFCNRA